MQTPEELLSQMQAEEKTDDVKGLPPITTIEIDLRGSRGRRYVGRFTYKVPTLADQIAIGRLKSTYLPQGGAADANAAILVEQICYLAVTIQDPKPDWWEPFEMYDAAPIGALYGEALSYERRFHGAAQDQRQAEGRAGFTESDSDGGSDEAREAPVGRKVQPSAQRREAVVVDAQRSR